MVFSIRYHTGGRGRIILRRRKGNPAKDPPERRIINSNNFVQLLLLLLLLLVLFHDSHTREDIYKIYFFLFVEVYEKRWQTPTDIFEEEARSVYIRAYLRVSRAYIFSGVFLVRTLCAQCNTIPLLVECL